jgi:uncharacterized Zn finger protein (UPF0148 family)
MKFSADKAGKRAKCPVCEAIVVIKAEEEAPQVKAKAEEAAAAVAAPPATAAAEEDDPEGAYGVTLDPELEQLKLKREAEERAKARARKQRQFLPTVTRKQKVIADADAWEKIRFGMLFTFLGAMIWIFAHAIQTSYVVIGYADYPEYGALIAANLEMRGPGPADDPDFPEPGRWWDVDELNIYLGMIAGRQFLGFAKTCLVISTLLYFFQAFLWGIGYALSIKVPPRYGAFGQVLVCIILAVLNFLFMFFFKLLPVMGIIGWFMIPFVVPEIAMTEYNDNRTIPIAVMWTGPGWPAFLVNILNLLVKFCFYLQPTFGCIFLWSVGRHLKDERIEQQAKGLTQMSLGTFFIMFLFHMVSLCGASGVLVLILRMLYTLWVGFLLLFLISYAVMLWKVRGVLWRKLHPENVLQEDKKPGKVDDDDDEED